MLDGTADGLGAMDASTISSTPPLEQRRQDGRSAAGAAGSTGFDEDGLRVGPQGSEDSSRVGRVHNVVSIPSRLPSDVRKEAVVRTDPAATR